MRRARRFLALPAPDRALALEAALSLAAASLLLALLPFRHAVRGRLNGPAEMPESDPDLLRQVGSTVEKVARHLPWRPLCLPQALAARAMLHRRGVVCTLHFGIRMEAPDRALRAHAWVTAGPVGVVGVPAGGIFTELARFSP